MRTNLTLITFGIPVLILHFQKIRTLYYRQLNQIRFGQTVDVKSFLIEFGYITINKKKGCQNKKFGRFLGLLFIIILLNLVDSLYQVFNTEHIVLIQLVPSI